MDHTIVVATPAWTILLSGELITMRRAIADFLIMLYSDESAVTTVEYALIAALLGVAALVAATQLGQSESDALNQSKTYFEGGP